MSFLVEMKSTANGVLAHCAVADIDLLEPTRSAALASIRSMLEIHARTVLAPQVAAIGRHAGGAVTCPQGFVKLVADSWYCKVTERRCPINATVSLQQLDEFYRGCDAPADTKHGVVGALEAGYEGAHHLPGKWLCPPCLKQEEDRYKSNIASDHYYYRFELHALSDILPEVATDPGRLKARTAFLKAGRNLRVMSCHVCAMCLIDAVEFLDGNATGRFEIVALRVAIS